MSGYDETVFVRKVKRPKGSGVWSAYVLAEDSDGLWLHTPRGSLFRGEDGEQIVFCEVGQDRAGVGRPIVQLIPRSGWWIATWTGDNAELAVSIDICTPPAWSGSEWSYTDLELDPYLTATGMVDTDDWDEFVEACEAGWIPEHEAANARHATAQVEHWLTQRDEPFGAKGRQWLDAAQARSLPPLRNLDDAPVMFPVTQTPGTDRAAT